MRKKPHSYYNSLQITIKRLHLFNKKIIIRGPSHPFYFRIILGGSQLECSSLTTPPARHVSEPKVPILPDILAMVIALQAPDLRQMPHLIESNSLMPRTAPPPPSRGTSSHSGCHFYFSLTAAKRLILLRLFQYVFR